MDSIYQISDKKIETINSINNECYDACTSTWERFPFPQILPSFVQRYYDPSLGNKVLDVGSGTGVLAEWLVKKGLDVFCIDPSSEMTHRCHAKGLKIEQCTIQQYKPKESFAMIFAILSLIHVPKCDFPEQLKKLSNSLTQNGILLLGMIEGKGESFSNDSRYPRFFAYYTADEISQIAKCYFEQVDYAFMKGGGIGYMLFALKKVN